MIPSLNLSSITSAVIMFAAVACVASTVRAADEPDLIFKRSTCSSCSPPMTSSQPTQSMTRILRAWLVISPFRKGEGGLGVAEEVSDISLACRQIGPIRIKQKFSQGDDMFRQRRSLFFKKMQIVRGCDNERNVLVYMVYSDKLIEGSPKNSTSSVPIMPWGPGDQIQRCVDFAEK